MSDVKVVDLTNVIAGPTIGTMPLIWSTSYKNRPCKPYIQSGYLCILRIGTNMGKKSVLLDIYKSNVTKYMKY